jgi:choline dehydrogenase-like flavoprotein
VTNAAPGRIQLSLHANNVESFERLKDRWVDILKKAGHASTSVPLHAYFKKRIPLEGVGHQNGTCRMGNDPATSVLDPYCKAHDLDNLYVVDASCFVSASAVNPSLTIIANAIRIADHLLARSPQVKDRMPLRLVLPAIERKRISSSRAQLAYPSGLG